MDIETAQLIKRRVYDSENNLLREDLAPISIPNNRESLMEYWREKDRLNAEAEAIAAQEEADRIAGLEQNPPEVLGAMALASLDERVTNLQEAFSELQDLSLATPEMVIRGSAQIARVAGLGAEIEATVVDAINRIDSTAANADTRLSELDGQVKRVVETVGQVAADCRQLVEKNSAAMLAKVSDSIAKRITALEVQAAQLRGPKGNTGNPGVAITIGSGVPKDPSVFEPLLGRGAIVGDIFIDGSDENRYAYRWTGSKFEKGMAMSGPTIVRDVKVSSLDASTKVFPTVSTASGGGGSGSFAADPIYLSGGSVTPNSSVLIGDSSRWTLNSTFRSGIVAVEIIPTGGPFGGQTNFVESSFILLAGVGGGDTFRFSEGYSLGNAITAGEIKVDFTGSIGAATVPGSLGISLPTGVSNAARLFMSITASTPPTGSPGYLVRGRIEWVPDAATGAALPNAIPLKAPMWQLI